MSAPEGGGARRPPGAAGPALEFDGVTHRYPGAAAAALADVSFVQPEGELVVVTGATASGKSTLLRAGNGLVPHFSGGRFRGDVRVAGRSTRTHPPRALADVAGFVPQAPAGAFVADRVEDELAYAMENLGVDPARMRRRVEEVLDMLAIAALRDRSVTTLSGGERQRVAIGAALTAGARLLLLDEPTSQLDPQGAEDVLAALQRMVHDLGMTVVVAEHRVERVAGFADSALGCLGGGEVTRGEPAAVFEAVGTGPPVAALGRALGWEPLPLTVRAARAQAASVTLAPPARARPAPGEAVVVASGLAAGRGARPVLTGIDLAIAAGEVVALMGRNGSGKTTLLRCLCGLEEPRAGTVAVLGRRPRPGRDVALCPQDPEAVLFTDSVEAEVRATLRARGGGDPRPVLERAGIEGLAGRHPRSLSEGQRLLTALAAIVATGAPVLLLDESTRGLDPAVKARLARLLHDHAAAGGAVVLATHDVELAAAVATRVVILGGGDVVADGEPGEVMADSPVFSPQTARVLGPGWLTPDDVVRAVAGVP